MEVIEGADPDDVGDPHDVDGAVAGEALDEARVPVRDLLVEERRAVVRTPDD